MKVTIHAGCYQQMAARQVAEEVARGWRAVTTDEVSVVVAGTSPREIAELFAAPTSHVTATNFCGQVTTMPLYESAEGVYLDPSDLLDPGGTAQKADGAYVLGKGSAGLGQALWQLRDKPHIYVGLAHAAAVDGGAAMLAELGEDAAPILAKTTAIVSFDRPLLGLDGSAADVRPVREDERWKAQKHATAVAAFFRDLEKRYPRPLKGQDLLRSRGWGRRDGSGMGGGAAALVGQLGGEIVSAATWVRGHVTLPESDLDIVVTSSLHPQNMGFSWAAAVAEQRQPQGTPVVVACAESSLSRHELAAWGVHGQMVAASPPGDIGIRLARTWSPNKVTCS
ncbi:MAG: hypothetical protein Q4A71_00570 [Actinomycetaceae bacterium]|nr:hypothetical protein [Actinomycetaceae bacterium]